MLRLTLPRLRSRDLVTLSCGALLVLSACGRGTGARPSGSSSDLISRIELSRSTASNAYDAVRQLRPSMLGGRGRTTVSSGEGGPVVYLDERRMGATSFLRDLTINTIYEIRFLSSSAAQIKWGQGHPHGVIAVTTLRQQEQVR